MEKILERRYPINGEGNANRLDVNIVYQKGDELDRRRGYFLSICPVHASGMFVTYEGWSGARVFLGRVSRKSKKKEQCLIDKYDDLFDHYVKPFCDDKGYTITIE